MSDRDLLIRAMSALSWATGFVETTRGSVPTDFGSVIGSIKKRLDEYHDDIVSDAEKLDRANREIHNLKALLYKANQKWAAASIERTAQGRTINALQDDLHRAQKRIETMMTAPRCKKCGAGLDVLGGCMAAQMHHQEGLEPASSEPSVPRGVVQQLSAEQRARDLLEKMGFEGAQERTAGDLVELANLLSEVTLLRKVRDQLGYKSPSVSMLRAITGVQAPG